MDNQSAISVSKNPEHHGQMKHLDLCFYWLRDAVNDKMITPSFVPTTEQVADILTKPLLAAKVEYCRRMMGHLSLSLFYITLLICLFLHCLRLFRSRGDVRNDFSDSD